MWWVPVIIAGAVVVGWASDYFLGKDNPVEQAAERVIEYELNLPPGTIDLLPEPKKVKS